MLDELNKLLRDKKQACTVGVQEFKVTSINGFIFLCDIQDIDNALKVIKEMNHEELGGAL